MNILLIQPCPYNKTRNKGKIYLRFLPFGLMCIQGFLKANGYGETSLRIYWKGEQRNVNADIDAYNPQVVGISCDSNNRAMVRAVAELVKNKNPAIKVVVGGVHATCCGQSMLRNVKDFDYIVHGEGEYTFKELLDALSQGTSLESVRGISFRQGRVINTTPARGRIHDLDALPFPCYDSLDPQLLKVTTHFRISASRGCFFKCSYCSASKCYGHIWIHRSPKNIVKEITYLVERFSPQRIYFNDDMVTADREYSKTLFSLIAAQKFNVAFSMQTRPEFLDEELLQIMKEAKILFFNIGIESASKKVLVCANRKPSSDGLKKERSIIAAARRLDLNCNINLMVGWPGETMSDIIETLKLIKESKPTGVCVNPLIIYPETDLYHFARAEGLIDESYWLNGKRPPKYMTLRRGVRGRVKTALFELIIFAGYFLCTASLPGIITTVRRKLSIYSLR